MPHQMHKGGALCQSYLFDAYAGDTIAVHRQDGVAAPLVLYDGAGLRNVAQTEKKEPGQGFETGVGWNLDAVLALQVADASGTVQFHVMGLGGAVRHFFVVLVFDPADNLFQHLFHGEHADDSAELIDHHCQVRAAGAELVEHLRGGLGFGYEHDLPQQAVDAKGAAGAAAANGEPPLFPHPQQGLIVEQPDDFFRRPLIYGQARMLLFDHGVQHVVQGGGARDRDDIVARDHDLAHRNGAEVEHAMDHVLLRLGQVPQTATGGDDQLEFLGGVYVAVRAALQVERPRDGVGRTLDDHHEGQHGAVEEEEQRSGQRGQPVGLGDGQILGHHLAEHHVKETDGQEGEEEAKSVEIPGDARRVQRRSEE